MIGLVIVLVILLIIVIGLILFIIFNKKADNYSSSLVFECSNETKEKLKDILDLKQFLYKDIFVSENNLTIAIDNTLSKIAIIENFNQAYDFNYKYTEISTSSIIGLEKGSNHTINLDYFKNNKKNTLSYAYSKKAEKFFYNLYKNILLKKIKLKYPMNNFTLSSGSDFECSYVWAFDSKDFKFIFYKNIEDKQMIDFDIRKIFLTIDTKYNYFQILSSYLSVELSTYEEDFFNKIFLILLNMIKKETNQILKNKIYFDSFNKIIYFTNSSTTVQSIVLDKIKEVSYDENRIHISLKHKEKTVIYPFDKEMEKKFDDFVTEYNLKKIATVFDYKIDKLINTTKNTKFIIDNSRSRIVYCAGLNTFSRFSYLTVAFENLEDARAQKISKNPFCRIFVKNGEMLDISCNKYEIAQYIEAQIKLIAYRQIEN